MCEGFDAEKLELMTTGSGVFTGAGQKSDALMRTRRFVSSLLFGEIKRHDTDLLDSEAYRPPDTIAPSSELAGGLVQVQKTAYKAVRKLESLYQHHSKDGEYQFDVSTVHPRKVLVIGRLEEFSTDGHINTEMLSSFELFRRSIVDIEVLTFDELYERAVFIVKNA